MARIVIITHEFDHFLRRRWPFFVKTSAFQIFDVMRELQHRGHTVILQQGLARAAKGDAALLHVDSTVVPQDYVDYAARFPVCLNLATADISKRRISGALLSRGDDWPGPVIVKTDLNRAGLAERRHYRHALRAGRPLPGPMPPAPTDYKVYESLSLVPESAFDDPALIVERFLAEPEPDGFAARFWVFCGDRGRCARYVASSRIAKGKDTLRSEEVQAPDQLRAIREKLGFDYGQFDFVMHDGQAILLDANRTPGRPRALRKRLEEGAPALADGFEQVMRARG